MACMKVIVRASFARATKGALVVAALAALGAGVGAASAGATTIQTDCSGLQAALDTVSSDGTIVLSGMCSGSYTLSSGAAFTLEGAPGTTSGFDGAGATGPLLGNGASTEAGAMTLSHLTFQHANLTNASALSIRASRVMLSDDSFLENEEHGEGAHAAFVDVGQSQQDCPSATGPAAITLTDSTFSGNKLVLMSSEEGGGAAWLQDTCALSRTVLEDNTFDANTIESDGTEEEVQVAGAGLQFVGSKTLPTPVNQSGNVFDTNSIVATPPAFGNYGGGGEWLEYASVTSVGDRFSHNTIAGTHSPSDARWSWGAGLGIITPASICNESRLPESTLEDAVITGNTIEPGTTSDLGGGGIYVGCSHLRVLDSTVTLNMAPIGAGIEGEPGDQLDLANSIVAEDSPGNEIAGFDESGGSVMSSFSDICAYAGAREPLAGAGNICANPLLADNGDPISFDVHETASSPTIDAGSNALVPSGLTTDAFGTARILAGHTGCTGSFPAVVDMGAAELQPAQPSCPAPVQQPTPNAGVSNPGPGLTHFVSLKLSSTGMALRLSCASTDGQGCSGTIYVTSDETLRGKKVVAVGASDRTKAPVRIAQASFSLPAGRTATFDVKLDSSGLELLRHFQTFSAWVVANEATANNSQVVFLIHSARLSEPERKRKKSKKHADRHL
jgi:hypothetical protein